MAATTRAVARAGFVVTFLTTTVAVGWTSVLALRAQPVDFKSKDIVVWVGTIVSLGLVVIGTLVKFRVSLSDNYLVALSVSSSSWRSCVAIGVFGMACCTQPARWYLGRASVWDVAFVVGAVLVAIHVLRLANAYTGRGTPGTKMH